MDIITESKDPKLGFLSSSAEGTLLDHSALKAIWQLKGCSWIFFKRVLRAVIFVITFYFF